MSFGPSLLTAVATFFFFWMLHHSDPYLPGLAVVVLANCPETHQGVR